MEPSSINPGPGFWFVVGVALFASFVAGALLHDLLYEHRRLRHRLIWMFAAAALITAIGWLVIHVSF